MRTCCVMHVCMRGCLVRIDHWLDTQVVYLDLRLLLLKDLYRFRVDVGDARLGAALPAIDQALAELCQASWPELHPLLARALLDGLAEALARVLLHGGPHRYSACYCTFW